MKTSIVEVGGLLSELSARGVEKQLARLPGVKKVEVNFVAGSATVAYDETAVDLKAIKARVHECGYHCSGERVPQHVCAPEDPPAAAAASVVPPVAHFHAGHAEPEPRRTHAERAAPAKAVAMAHEMGHGGGMDMQAMVRDMRNRFWVCLIFSIPIFIYTPMGGLFTPPEPPFGPDLNLWLFGLATVAVIWPSWPFFVAAWRALKNGALNMAVLVVLSVGTGYLFSLGATLKACSSSRRWRCCWCSSCSAIGWRCVPVRGPRTPFARSWTWARLRRPCCATARSRRSPPLRC